MAVSRETSPRTVALERGAFLHRVQRCSGEPLADATLGKLYRHYELLLRWNQRLSLVGPGTVADAPEIHYGEALAALALVPSTATGTLVDVGSGAGFPGFVLAAARPSLHVVLVESRERKWAFLKTAVRETGVAAESLLGAVDRGVPEGFPERVDWLTMRALKLPQRAWEALLTRLASDARVLVWAGSEEPRLPGETLLRRVRSIALPGSHSKRILELVRAEARPD